MTLVGECVETEPSSFEETMQQSIWVDAMVDEYDSIVHNSVWDVVPRLENNTDGLEDHVKTTFLNGEIEEEVFIEQPKGFETFDHESHVCQLKRALYVLEQAPCAWYTRIDNYFTGLGFTKSEADVNLYNIVVKGKLLIIVLYVDDLILTSDDQLIVSCKEDLAREFEMKDMGLMHYFLGMEVWQKDGELFVSQGTYANEILRRFHMEKCKPMQNPLAGNWRKEDATSGEVVEATMYRWTEGVKLQGFTDADWAVSPSDQKSTLGGIFNLGSATISWYNRKQRLVALSLAEAKYMATSQAACEAIWMWKILVGLFDQRMDPTMIYCDNQICIKLFENLVFHDRSKHIDIWYHHLRDCVARRIMLLQYISTKEQDADILTKAFSKSKFEFHRDRIGVADNPFLVKREC
eukprot:PITA_29069